MYIPAPSDSKNANCDVECPRAVNRQWVPALDGTQEGHVFGRACELTYHNCKTPPKLQSQGFTVSVGNRSLRGVFWPPFHARILLHAVCYAVFFYAVHNRTVRSTSSPEGTVKLGD